MELKTGTRKQSVIYHYLYCEQTGNTIDKQGFHQGFSSLMGKNTNNDAGEMV